MRSPGPGSTAIRLYTIGYEGKTQAEFLDEIASFRVAQIIDVRAVAASRRPGFSKTALSSALAHAGIGYLHLRALGTPKEGREAARRGQTATMRAIYEEQLALPEAEVAFAQLRLAIGEMPSALLCFERDALTCHRTLAERLQASDGVVLTDI